MVGYLEVNTHNVVYMLCNIKCLVWIRWLSSMRPVVSS